MVETNAVTNKNIIVELVAEIKLQYDLLASKDAFYLY
jgi:hypothetical protein